MLKPLGEEAEPTTAPAADRDCVAAAGTRWSSPFAIEAQATRAILFASAMATSIRGLRANMRASQEAAGAPRRAAQRTTDMAPMISRRLRSRCPVFETCPSRALPAEECCRGTRPNQAAKSRFLGRQVKLT